MTEIKAVCPRCNGSGYDPEPYVPEPLVCQDCAGKRVAQSDEEYWEYYRKYDERHGIR